MLKEISVVAAILIKEGKVFITQRGKGNGKGFFEFPGGKVEPFEKEEEALKREIKEELDAEIEVHRLFMRVKYDYPSFLLHMACYFCSFLDSHYSLKEAIDARFVFPNDLLSYSFLPPDLVVVEQLIPYLASQDNEKKTHLEK